MKKLCVIYYFSGTGNAWSLAETTAREFEQKGYKAILSPIEKGNERAHPEHENSEFIGIVSAVYGFGMPQMVAKFLRRLPASKGQKSFVFISMGNTEVLNLGLKKIDIPATEGICIHQARFWLKTKGYQVINAHAFEMPTNWILLLNSPEEIKAHEYYSNSRELIKKYVQDIIDFKVSIKTLNIIAVVILGLIYFCFVLFARRWLGKFFVTNDKCDSCKVCVEKCPSKTIQIKKGKPYWKFSCQQCFRCINMCPKNAIEISAINLFAALWFNIFGWMIYNMSWFDIPTQSKLMGFVYEFAFVIFVTFIIVWIIHYLEFHPKTGKILPKLFLTSRRKRYKHTDFKP